MPDISMCTQTLCPNAESCYRIKAKPSEWQSYSQFEYTIGADGVICEHYWPMYKTKASSTIEA